MASASDPPPYDLSVLPETETQQGPLLTPQELIYSSSSSSSQRKGIILTLHLVTPSTPTGPCYPGPTLKKFTDVISFTNAVNLVKLRDTLFQRATERGILPKLKGRLVGGVVALVDGERIVLDQVNWDAAKELVMFSEKAKLEFVCAVVEQVVSRRGVEGRVSVQ